MNDRPTPETDAFREMVIQQYKEDECTGIGLGNILLALTDIARLERERDEWKAKFIQQNKDLGCEMMDPAGTIWDHAKKLQDENKALQEQLNAALMLGKMQERRHERELEQVREQYRLSSVCRRLLEENKQLKGEQS